MYRKYLSVIIVAVIAFVMCSCGIITISPASPGGSNPRATPAATLKPTPTPERFTVVFDENEEFETDIKRKRAQHIDPHIITAIKLLNTVPNESLDFNVHNLDHNTLPKEKDKITDSLELQLYNLFCDTATTFGNFKINYKNYGERQAYLNAFFNALDKYHIDHPELYMYMDIGSDGGYDTNGYYMPGKWLDSQTNDIAAVKAEVDRYYRIIDRIIEKMPQGLTNREKCYYFAFLIASCNRYDYGLRTKSHIYPAYACLADGLSVCSGYADAFYVLCRHEGIYCVTDAGYSPEQDPANPAESHVWNLLQTDDGYLYMDITWYDSREPDIYNSYRDGWFGYLMMTEEKLHDYGYIRYADISQ
ncbi:MAG: hypothetical protein IKK99_08860 [Oscillospiraceae bacterium]|nr:hypothetical protein [Oscillospiraceae bacterium]